MVDVWTNDNGTIVLTGSKGNILFLSRSGAEKLVCDLVKELSYRE